MTDAGDSAEAITLRYSVWRSEISAWYWTMFLRPNGLWRYWLVIGSFVFISVLYVESVDHHVGAFDYVKASTAVLLLFGFFVIFPQLAYKSRERTLTVGPTGIETKIGAMTGRRSWQDIASIVDQGDFIAMVVAGAIPLPGLGYVRTRAGNAFIVPNRAFENAADRSIFIQRVSAWRATQAKAFPHFSKTRYYAEQAA